MSDEVLVPCPAASTLCSRRSQFQDLCIFRAWAGRGGLLVGRLRRNLGTSLTRKGTLLSSPYVQFVHSQHELPMYLYRILRQTLLLTSHQPLLRCLQLPILTHDQLRTFFSFVALYVLA